MAGWAISTTVVGIIQCMPFEYGWDPTIPGRYCLDYGLLVLVAGIINIITHFIILGMPIPLVWELHISKQKKYMLIFTFAMGSSACIINIVRLAFALMVNATADSSWDNVATGLLSAAELMMGNLAVSIPTYRPLYRHLVYGSAATDNTPHLYPNNLKDRSSLNILESLSRYIVRNS